MNVDVKAEEESDEVMGGCLCWVAGSSKRARSAGFTPSVPVAIKEEATLRRSAIHAQTSSVSLETKPEVSAETAMPITA